KRIERVALMTVEGEKDDISGLGQTKAAHELCSSLPADKKVHYEQKGVGHYGVFNGSRFRAEIMPRVSDFMRSAASAPKLHVVAGARGRLPPPPAGRLFLRGNGRQTGGGLRPPLFFLPPPPHPTPPGRPRAPCRFRPPP